MLRVWRLVRPTKKSGGMEVKLLPSRKRSWSEVRLAREGRSPESLLPWRARVWSWESWLRSEGRVPVRDWDRRVIEVTLLELSHDTPGHLQTSPPDVQPDGDRASLSSFIIAASSAVVKEKRVRRKRRRRRRLGGECREAILGILG